MSLATASTAPAGCGARADGLFGFLIGAAAVTVILLIVSGALLRRMR
jgi:hypothetical protein